MNVLKIEGVLVKAIAWLTIATGTSQILFAPHLLPLLGADAGPAPSQLLATVGMFMVVVSGALLNALRRPESLPVVAFWSSMQKIGAAAFMGWGVYRGVFSPLALLITGFDFASGVLFLDFRRRFMALAK